MNNPKWNLKHGLSKYGWLFASNVILLKYNLELQTLHHGLTIETSPKPCET
jgi:hypothetical protein